MTAASVGAVQDVELVSIDPLWDSRATFERRELDALILIVERGNAVQSKVAEGPTPGPVRDA